MKTKSLQTNRSKSILILSNIYEKVGHFDKSKDKNNKNINFEQLKKL